MAQSQALKEYGIPGAKPYTTAAERQNSFEGKTRIGGSQMVPRDDRPMAAQPPAPTAPTGEVPPPAPPDGPEIDPELAGIWRQIAGGRHSNAIVQRAALIAEGLRARKATQAPDMLDRVSLQNVANNAWKFSLIGIPEGGPKEIIDRAPEQLPKINITPKVGLGPTINITPPVDAGPKINITPKVEGEPKDIIDKSPGDDWFKPKINKATKPKDEFEQVPYPEGTVDEGLQGAMYAKGKKNLVHAHAGQPKIWGPHPDEPVQSYDDDDDDFDPTEDLPTPSSKVVPYPYPKVWEKFGVKDAQSFMGKFEGLMKKYADPGVVPSWSQAELIAEVIEAAGELQFGDSGYAKVGELYKSMNSAAKQQVLGVMAFKKNEPVETVKTIPVGSKDVDLDVTIPSLEEDQGYHQHAYRVATIKARMERVGGMNGLDPQDLMALRYAQRGEFGPTLQKAADQIGASFGVKSFDQYPIIATLPPEVLKRIGSQRFHKGRTQDGHAIFDGKEGGIAWAYDNYIRSVDRYTRPESAAGQFWHSQSYEEFNGAIYEDNVPPKSASSRDPDTLTWFSEEDWPVAIELLDSMIAKGATKGKNVFYRGSPSSPYVASLIQTLLEAQKNHRLTDVEVNHKGYFAVALNEDRAAQFANYAQNPVPGVPNLIMEVRDGGGTPSAFIDALVHNNPEEEVLFGRNTKYRVISFKMPRSRKHRYPDEYGPDDEEQYDEPARLIVEIVKK